MSALKSVFRELKQAGLTGFASLTHKLHQLFDAMDNQLDDIVKKLRAQDHFDALDTPKTPDHPRISPPRPDGTYEPGTLPSLDELRILTKTDPDTAYYWSGRDLNGNGVGPEGSGIAEQMATARGGQTLEQTLAANGVDPLPVWNEADSESVRFWTDASAAFAENANGTVHAVVGSDLRPGNIWQTVEVPRLLDNQNVTSVIEINVDTGLSSRVK
ncbi:hypothetical protein [Microbacterium sp.]|uniref:hypothetical protein n=1 Tax=Microbacterium sp. TaxID=51671 RepID=UPI0039E68FB7